MEWRDEGLVLGARRHGESAVILSLLTRDHGRHAGIVPGGAGKRARGIYEAGNVLAAHWRARLEEHLGTYRCELIEAHAATILADRDRLACLTALTAMAETALPEREPHPGVYDAARVVVRALAEGEPGWAGLYVRWELGLLSELGYGLDLSSCAATGRNDQLVYVSPKSARAVSASAGEPYKDKLLALPGFLLDGSTPSPGEARAGLELTGYFLERHVLPPHVRALPESRQRLVDRFSR